MAASYYKYYNTTTTTTTILQIRSSVSIPHRVRKKRAIPEKKFIVSSKFSNSMKNMRFEMRYSVCATHNGSRILKMNDLCNVSGILLCH